MSPQTRFRGVYPVLYAFFDRAGRLDEAAMRAQVEHCLAAGAHGICVLGLVTEVHKMDVNERLALVETVGGLVDRRVPYAVTIGEPTVAGQIAFARAARAAGADWVILQPPAARGSEAEIVRFFGAVADALDFPVAVQNNPVNLDVSLSVASLVALAERHPNVGLLKGEGAAVDVARVIEETGGRLSVFGGHGGVEFMTHLRSGGAGLIPAPDTVAAQVRIFDLFESGRPDAMEEAERIHRAILPVPVFMTRSVPGLLCYGKRFFSEKIGLDEPVDRAPAMTPTAFGIAEMRRLLAHVQAVEAEIQAIPRAAE
ncbi:dihydrodipicolinate synthase family protein [Salinarimonas sp.]|uniref:dihydrodipicolinate synthase family protein n=1 Tax=Salinarimonas sp. TaxID=2766526 RepID=UPI00391B85E3